MEIEQAGRRKIVRASGIKRRKLILEATLRVILRDGVRGVRHRAIAEEAQVPLASTTYYFKDIEELLSETFLFWNHRANAHSHRFRDHVQQHLKTLSSDVSNNCNSQSQTLKDSELRQQYIEHLSELASSYLIYQIKNHWDDRLIELAFHHEAVRSEKLQQVVRHRLDVHRQTLELFFKTLGSNNAEADSQISLSVLERLEYEAVVGGGAIDDQKIQRIINRHISNTLTAISQD